MRIGNKMPRGSLNLSIDTALIERGRRYSEQNDTSISQLVADLLANLPLREEGERRELPPITRALRGIAAGGAEADVSDYHEYLWEKYGP